MMNLILHFLICSALFFSTVPSVVKEQNTLVVQDAEGLVIENRVFTGYTGNGIELKNSRNIIIKNCKFINLSNPENHNGGLGVHIDGGENITIENCLFRNVNTAVYAHRTGKITIIHNEAYQMQGPFPRGQFVQLNQCIAPGTRIARNYIQNHPDSSYTEDAISIYKSQGSAEDPILIENNLIKGGGPSLSGGGIMLSDGHSSNVVAQHNVLINPGQYGIAVNNGENIAILNNLVYSEEKDWSNVGIYVRRTDEDGICKNHRIERNRVDWTCGRENCSKGQKNPFYYDQRGSEIQMLLNDFGYRYDPADYDPAQYGLLNALPEVK